MKWAFGKRTTADVAEWWNARPCNVRHSDADVRSLEYSREVTRRKYTSEPHIPGFANFPRWCGRNVLEVGCGIGTDTIEFARAGARVTAIDLSDASVAIARMRLASEGLTADVSVGDAEHLSLRKSFDLIYSFGVLHHTPRPDVALAHLRDLATPTTELRIMLYHRWSVKALRLGLTDRLVARGSEARSDSPVTYAFSRHRARKLLASTGWRVTSLRVDHIFPWRVSDYHEGRYVKTAVWRFIPTWAFRRLEHLVGWHLLVVASPK